MNFNHKFNFIWGNGGAEPSQNLKENGFTGGYKPPAGVFNWFWRKTMNAVTELQESVTTVEESIPTATSELDNDSGYITIDDVPEGTAVIDNLTSDNHNQALSAYQGKVLNTNKVDKVDGKALSTNDYTTAEKNKLAGIATGANAYTHPSYTAKSSGLYKVTVDGTGHISGTTAVAKSDIINLGITEGTGENVEGKAQKVYVATTSSGQEGDAILNDYAERTFDNDGVPKTGNVATGLRSLAVNWATTATGDSSFAAGQKTYATGIAAVAFGNRTKASGDGSFAIGQKTNASALLSTASGINTTASGSYSFASGADTTASGDYSFASGHNTKASGDSSFASGADTTASGNYSFAGGYNTTASGGYSFASGAGTTANNYCAVALGENTTASSHQLVCGYFNTVYDGADLGSQSSDQTIFMVGCGTTSATKNAFRITADGKCRGSSAFSGSGADFAELYEWLDGNPENEDRRGRFVTLKGNKIKLANVDDDYILGVITARASFVGNAASEEWKDKYLTDIYGEKITEEVFIPEKTDEQTGKIIPAHTVTQFKVNPDYDPEQEYKGREFRKEWATVGVKGRIIVDDDGTCQVDGYCKPSVNGVATSSESGYRVIDRLDDSHIEIVI